MTAEPFRLFIFGMGYSATAFAQAIKDRASWIGGTVRDIHKANRLAGEGHETFVFDGLAADPGVRRVLAETTHLLISVPPGEGPDPVLVNHAADIAAAPRLRWIGYLSTIGVYGDYGGAWVSERTTPHPASSRATARLEAEREWTRLAVERDTPLGIFRLSGIYGPGRNALVNLAHGTAHRIVKPGQVFNRIHVADIAATLTAAIDRPARRIYNLADDEPAPGEDVVTYAARLMGVPPPPEVSFEEAALSPLARSFYAENKRISNARIKDELGVTLAYPTYRDGLGAMWQQGDWPGETNAGSIALPARRSKSRPRKPG
jgi:nucleoside-diphosphate-sugar epimerase